MANNRRPSSLRHAGDRLDEAMRLAVAGTHGRTHVGVVAGGVRLHLEQQPRPVEMTISP